MKITLINPPWYNNLAEPVDSTYLGLSYLASYLRSKGHEVEAIDALFEGRNNIVPVKFKYQNLFRIGLDYASIAGRISMNTDLIGISAPFSNHALIVKELASEIKKRNPNRPIMIGGTYASTSPEDILSTDVDYAVRGEGEIPLERYLKGESADKIKGICSKRNGVLIDNGMADVIGNLDEIPFPARDIFHYEKVLDSSSRARLRVATDIVEFNLRDVPIITSRGCPYDCTFCSIHFTHGYKWRCRSADNVIKEILHLVENYNVNEVAMIDDNLTQKRDRLIEILDKLIKLKLNLTWTTPNGVRVDYLDEELLEKMKLAGCRSLVLGIQHGDPEMLERMGTKLDLSKVEEVVKICAKLKLEMAAFFIIGHPGENRRSFMKIIEYGKRLGRYGLKDFRLNIARAYPKTKLFNYCRENDLFVIKDTENLLIFPNDDTEANIKTDDFTPKELIWRREYAKRKLMAVENSLYWNLVYFSERLRFKELLHKLIPASIWNKLKRAIFVLLKKAQ